MMLNSMALTSKFKTSEIRANLNNPRVISEENFDLLVKSIQQSPWMLEIRPIVIDEDNVVLGGNQRFKAALQAGLEEVWVMHARDLSEDQKRRFILRDNIDFGEWDMQILRQHYTQQELIEYGSDIQLLPEAQEQVLRQPSDIQCIPQEELYEPDIPQQELLKQSNKFNENAIKQITFTFANDLFEDTLRSMDEISKKLDLDDNSDVLLHLINFYEVSNGMHSTSDDTQ